MKWAKTPQRITYPTGLVVDRYALENPRRTLRIAVEQTVKLGRHCYRDDRVNDAVVSGSVIPRGARGLIRHETLPTRIFRAEWYGTRGALRNAQAFAWKWYAALLLDAEGGAA